MFGNIIITTVTGAVILTEQKFGSRVRGPDRGVTKPHHAVLEDHDDSSVLLVTP